MNDALRYRMLRQLVDYPDQMDADLDELISEAIENYRATTQPGSESNENRSGLGRSILARSGLECFGPEKETSRCNAHTAVPSQDGPRRQSSLIPDPIGNPTNLDFISSEDANAKNAKHDF
jgi:hypothetical protein